MRKIGEKVKCDFCRTTDLDEYVDGKTQFGPWANMCISCYVDNGIGIGTGRGQHYEWNDKTQSYDKTGG